MIEYSLFEGEGGWVVKATTSTKGDLDAAFSGFGAQERATAYALWMNKQYPVPPPSEIVVVDTKGRTIKLVLSGIEWTSDTKRGTITARTKSNVVPLQNEPTVIGEQK